MPPTTSRQPKEAHWRPSRLVEPNSVKGAMKMVANGPISGLEWR
jgi:hypothetical protein